MQSAGQTNLSQLSADWLMTPPIPLLFVQMFQRLLQPSELAGTMWPVTVMVGCWPPVFLSNGIIHLFGADVCTRVCLKSMRTQVCTREFMLKVYNFYDMCMRKGNGFFKKHSLCLCPTQASKKGCDSWQSSSTVPASVWGWRWPHRIKHLCSRKVTKTPCYAHS